MLMIMIIIPTILYSFFFLINCPPNPFQIFRRRSTTAAGDSCPEGSKTAEKNADEDSNGNIELVVAGEISELGKESECPVCLSVFTEGEELKKIKICKHLFHKSCIDKWLSSHCNCPVCRAFVAGSGQSKSKERENHRLLPRDVVRRDDLWQGLPDSAGLI